MYKNKVKKLGFYIILLLSTSFGAERPLILISNDYGIVTNEDIERSKKEVEPWCWEFDRECPTQYWQCFSTDSFRSDCQLSGELDSGAPSYLSVVYLNEGKSIIELMTRRPWSLEHCQDDLMQWKKLIENEDVFCVSSQFVYFNYEGHPLWLMDNLKTKKGKWSYFGDD